MKAVRILKEPGKPLMTIETETERWFLGKKLKPIKRTFIANKEYPTGYWNWVELPDKKIISQSLGDQLNVWLNFEI